jgi:hypothetical protein
LNSYNLLGALQKFIKQRGVEMDSLTADPMVRLMIDWFRLVPIDQLERTASTDVLIYRYGGWSEGCATGFNFSLLRRITETHAGGDTDWIAGITLMFEPSFYANLTPFSTVSSDWKSIEAFLSAIENSPAFTAVVAAKPMSVVVESGGLR